MLRGENASAAHARALETYLVTVADHGLNASTFAARVIASTRAGLLSSVVGALCALKGPLHGGAPGPVLDMLDAIGSFENIRPWLKDALARDERLMGFGHRVYRVRDPRADVLKATASALRGGQNRIRFAEAVEAEALALLAQHRPDGVSIPMSNSIRRWCSRHSGFPATASRTSSRWAAWPDGRRTSSSRSGSIG